MQYLLFLAIVISAFLLSGCATLDTSTLETARTLNDRSMEVSAISTMNLNLNSAVSVEHNQFGLVDSHDNKSELTMAIVGGPKLNLKIIQGLDFCGRIYSSGSHEHWGTRLGIKKQLYHSGKSYLALMPSYSYLKGTQTEFIGDPGGSSEQYSYSFDAHGLDLQLLYTYELSEKYDNNLALRSSWHSYEEVYNGVSHGPYDIWQGGLTASIRKNVFGFYLQPELGLELVRNTDGIMKAYIPVNFSFGYSF